MINCSKWIIAAAVLTIAVGLRPDTIRADDIQVNTVTLLNQLTPWVAMDADGDSIIVWDSELDGIRGQRYTADGTPAGGEFQVNIAINPVPSSAAVAMAPGGDFVVVWASNTSAGTDSDTWSVQGQRYSSDGTLAGGEFQVNTYTTLRQFQPAVATATDGSFLVVWTSEGSTGSDADGYSIQGQRFAADGTPISGEFQINAYTTGDQLGSAVAIGAGGDFVVVWSSDGSDGTDVDSTSVRGQRFSPSGTRIGSEFQVNTYTTDFQAEPSMVMTAGGEVIIVWTSQGSGHTDSSSWSIQGQRLAADGSPLGGEFQVNSYTTGLQSSASVALAPGGDFVVAWASRGSVGNDTSYNSIQAQHYAADGSPRGGQFQVNSYTTSRQSSPSVALRADGEFVVTWQSYGSAGNDDFGASIQKTAAMLIFADGFESGNTLSWSATVP